MPNHSSDGTSSQEGEGDVVDGSQDRRPRAMATVWVLESEFYSVFVKSVSVRSIKLIMTEDRRRTGIATSIVTLLPLTTSPPLAGDAINALAANADDANARTGINALVRNFILVSTAIGGMEWGGEESIKGLASRRLNPNVNLYSTHRAVSYIYAHAYPYDYH